MPQARPGHAQRTLLARSAGSSRRRELPDAASEQGLRHHRHGRRERGPMRTKGTTDGEVPKSSRPAGDCQSPGGGNSAVRQWTVGWAGGRRVTSCPRLQTRQSKSMAGKWPGSVLTGCRGIVAADKAQAGTTFSPSLCAACRVLKDRPVSTQFGQCCSRLGVGRGRASAGMDQTRVFRCSLFRLLPRRPLGAGGYAVGRRRETKATQAAWRRLFPQRSETGYGLNICMHAKYAPNPVCPLKEQRTTLAMTKASRRKEGPALLLCCVSVSGCRNRCASQA